MQNEINTAPLGKKSEYVVNYTPSLLFPISRQSNREKIAITSLLPFHGFDIWNGYELSWLNLKGKPENGIAEFIFPADSPNIIESKSLKLYLNSFNQTKFPSKEEVVKTIKKDLSQYADADVQVSLRLYDQIEPFPVRHLEGELIDGLDIEVFDYHLKPDLLKIESQDIVEEKLCSHLLKSNCLVTGQPDWGSLLVHYKGPKIDRESLLKYIISFRNHTEFAEPGIERIFMDISRLCQPERLAVYGRFTRRGGLDINPFRSNFLDKIKIDNIRNPRQ